MTETSDTPSPPKPLPRILGTDLSDEYAGETVVSNGHAGSAAITICVPSYNDDATPLIQRLSSLPDADRCTLIVFDDGSNNSAATSAHSEAIMAFPGPARLVTSHHNLGRSHARNRLVARAEADWVLMLDADMLPDDDTFLSNYLATLSRHDGPAMISGGFTLLQVTAGRHQQLHYAQAAKSDCLTATERRAEPGRYVFTSNILVHRLVLEDIGFDESFSGWGWEDTDWGLRVIERYPIDHIDNTATHLGLETDSTLVEKFGSSAQNFARLVEKHPAATEKMALLKAARKVKGVPLLKPFSRAISLQRILPIRLRLLALKVFRASAYSEYLVKNV